GKGIAGDGLWQVYVLGYNFSLLAPTPAIPPGAVGWGAVLPQVSAVCQASTTQNFNTKGYAWRDGGCGIGGCYSHINTPNKKACVYANTNLAYSSNVVWSIGTMIGASSYHSGGVNVGFLDGSVKFIKDSISPATWGGIATMAGGEALSSDSY